jgi:predicted small lipoprotein YifL
MKNLKTLLLSVSLILFTLGLSACGQKGPLKVDQPAPIQEEEQSDTI